MDSVDERFLVTEPDLPGSVIEGSSITELLRPSVRITEEFLQGAVDRGDWCHVYKDGDEIASYGWYSKAAVPLDDYFSVTYSREYTYMYRGYTATDYRGRKLHAFGMGAALRHAVSRGDLGLISYVEGNNFASLRSCKRLGYIVFGSCWVFRIFSINFSFRSPGCRNFDFKVEPGYQN